MDTKEIAAIILDQLGGHEFLMMTGAYNLVCGKDNYSPYLQFNLKAGEFNIYEIARVKIALMPSDTYSLYFYKNEPYEPIKGLGVFLPNYVLSKQLSGIYYDQLQDIFEIETNLLVTFSPRKNSTVKIAGGIMGKVIS